MAESPARRAADEFNRFAEQTGAPGRCDPSLTFRTPELVQALSIWREKANGAGIPLRRDLGARELKAVLPDVIIVDVIGSGEKRRYRTRLMGTSVARLVGDNTGKFLDETVGPPFYERWSRMLDAALIANGPLRFAGRVEFGHQEYLDSEALIAPLVSQAGAADGVLLIVRTSLARAHQLAQLAGEAGHKTQSVV